MASLSSLKILALPASPGKEAAFGGCACAKHTHNPQMREFFTLNPEDPKYYNSWYPFFLYTIFTQYWVRFCLKWRKSTMTQKSPAFVVIFPISMRRRAEILCVRTQKISEVVSTRLWQEANLSRVKCRVFFMHFVT